MDHLSYSESFAIVYVILPEYAGIVRNEAGLKRGLHMLGGLERELKMLCGQNVRERTMKEESSSALFSIKVILTASLGRKESREVLSGTTSQRKTTPTGERTHA